SAAYSTGDEGGDLVLNGGLPDQALSLIIGPPGSGKTVFALQIAFKAAQAGRNVVYLTNTSESHVRLLQQARHFAFFDEQVIRKNFNLISINTHVQQQGVDATINYILDVARSAKADLLIIDNYMGLKQLFQTQGTQGINLMYTLISRLSLFAFTTVLIGTYGSQDIGTESEFAIADAIVDLAHPLQGMQRQRLLSVMKLRGKASLEGLHPFLISDAGITVFPRQETIPFQDQAPSGEERLAWGLPELDQMLSGGVFARSTTLLRGSAGSGKTTLGLRFVLGGGPGEPGLFVSFQETAAQLGQRLRQLGASEEQVANLRVAYIPPVQLNLDMMAWQIRKLIATCGARRVVIDAVDQMLDSSPQNRHLGGFMAAFLAGLRDLGATAVLLQESTAMVGGGLVVSNDVPAVVADTTIVIHTIEQESTVDRSIVVVKQRGSPHDRRLRHLDMVDGNIAIGAPLSSANRDTAKSPQLHSPSSGEEASQ
ncbi:MAG TPA: ATPase domain-containing protein, partial [Herpetosiphonaceae bacterium]|nr:ATPase domain-containing protein [Herpetosiphonaceae bacterium]